MTLNLRLCKIDEHGFLVCIKYGVWGSRKNRFIKWKAGDHLAFVVEKSLAGLAEVSGKPFYSEKVIWRNGVFPFRIPLKFKHVLSKEDRVPLDGEVTGILTSAWGKRYSWGFAVLKTLPEKDAEKIMKIICSRPNHLDSYLKNIDELMKEAAR
ncbi:MAG: hypothetical protein QXY74_05195 [Candidatus Bathyarchaeia archaeon]